MWAMKTHPNLILLLICIVMTMVFFFSLNWYSWYWNSSKKVKILSHYTNIRYTTLTTVKFVRRKSLIFYIGIIYLYIPTSVWNLARTGLLKICGNAILLLLTRYSLYTWAWCMPILYYIVRFIMYTLYINVHRCKCTNHRAIQI